jgi:hypothetical protein
VARTQKLNVSHSGGQWGYGCHSGVSVPVQLANRFANALRKAPYSSSTLVFAICNNALFIFVNLASSER